MAIQVRTSGITIEASGEVVAGAPLKLRPRGQPAKPATRGAPRTRGAAPAQAVLSEQDAIVAAFGEQQLDLVEAIPLEAPTAGTPRARGAAPRGVGPHGDVRINVPVRKDETAVVLVERDGVYEWILDGEQGAPPATTPPAPRSRGATRAVPAFHRTLSFSISLPPAAAPAKPAGPATRGAVSDALLKMVGGKVVAYVFRFVMGKAVKGLTKLLERSVREGLVHINSLDPASWPTLADDASLPLPQDRAARVLLLVHGTFSSTLGSYGALAAHPDGQALLRAALAHYDLIIGWDHRTLSALPSDNAIDIVARLERIGFKQPPQVDAVAYSRGGLVFRSLVEQMLPSSPLKIDLQRAVFVACTNGGTELARAENWSRFADRYLNVAAAGARALALVPGFNAASTVLSAAIRGVAVLVKAIASAAITDEGIPGLAAMDPAGNFVREINEKQDGQPTPENSFYCVVTSTFDTSKAANTDPSVMSPSLLLKLGDHATDSLYGKPNDLVVHVESMTQIDVDSGSFVDDKLDFGANGHVHHCNYFAQPETAQALLKWFRLPQAATSRSRPALPRKAVVKKAVKKSTGRVAKQTSRAPRRGK
ncbi:MAG: hypothetical protein WDO12_13555 [Pseudomonadota bacterium]